MNGKDAKELLAPGTGSSSVQKRSSAIWRRSYDRFGQRAVLLHELRLQGLVACALQLVVALALQGGMHAKFYSLDSRLVPLPIPTWFITPLTCCLGLVGLVLLRSLLLGLHVVLGLALGAALGAYHTGVYLVMADRCDLTQSSFRDCGTCPCAATNSCTREVLRAEPSCAACGAWPTDVCSKAGGFLPYMGLLLLLITVLPSVFSLVVLMRLEKSHSELASRVMYARALVLRELERLRGGGGDEGAGTAVDPRVLTHMMATLLRHGGRQDRALVAACCDALQLDPGDLEVEWQDVEAKGSRAKWFSMSVGPAPSTIAFAATNATTNASRITSLPSGAAGPTANGTAIPATAAAVSSTGLVPLVAAPGATRSPGPAGEAQGPAGAVTAPVSALAPAGPGSTGPNGGPSSPADNSYGDGNGTRQRASLWRKLQLLSDSESDSDSDSDLDSAGGLPAAGEGRGGRQPPSSGTVSAKGPPGPGANGGGGDGTAPAPGPLQRMTTSPKGPLEKNTAAGGGGGGGGSSGGGAEPSFSFAAAAGGGAAPVSRGGWGLDSAEEVLPRRGGSQHEGVTSATAAAAVGGSGFTEWKPALGSTAAAAGSGGGVGGSGRGGLSSPASASSFASPLPGAASRPSITAFASRRNQVAMAATAESGTPLLGHGSRSGSGAVYGSEDPMVPGKVPDDPSVEVMRTAAVQEQLESGGSVRQFKKPRSLQKSRTVKQLL